LSNVPRVTSVAAHTAEGVYTRTESKGSSTTSTTGIKSGQVYDRVV